MSETTLPLNPGGEPSLPRALIVDDSRMVRASIIRHIRGRYEFREEGDGEAAWQALMVDPQIRLVITDIGMPRLDGFGLLERIRGSRLSRIHDLPVIVISGDEDDEAREKARRLGASDFITKGIGTTELLARLDSLTRLGDARRELEATRAALDQASPKDPTTGLASRAYLDNHGEQELALARRHQGDICAMVMEIDGYEALLGRLGSHVVELINRKLSKILSTRVRKEDTVAQLAPGQFALLSPAIDLDGCTAFALRMQRAIDKLVMTYRDERIQISVSIGVAGSAEGVTQSVDALIQQAGARAQSGLQAGGNRVVGPAGEVGPEAVERLLRRQVSIDHVLGQLKAGANGEVRARMRDVVHTLMPLLELLESDSRCGIPLAWLTRYAREEHDGGASTENTSTGS